MKHNLSFLLQYLFDNVSERILISHSVKLIPKQSKSSFYQIEHYIIKLNITTQFFENSFFFLLDRIFEISLLYLFN